MRTRSVIYAPLPKIALEPPEGSKKQGSPAQALITARVMVEIQEYRRRIVVRQPEALLAVDESRRIVLNAPKHLQLPYADTMADNWRRLRGSGLMYGDRSLWLAIDQGLNGIPAEGTDQRIDLGWFGRTPERVEPGAAAWGAVRWALAEVGEFTAGDLAIFAPAGSDAERALRDAALAFAQRAFDELSPVAKTAALSKAPGLVPGIARELLAGPFALDEYQRAVAETIAQRPLAELPEWLDKLLMAEDRPTKTGRKG